MGYTKQEFVNDAFDEIGLANYNFDLQPEQLQSAVRKLDRMMATWNGDGIRLGYPLPSSPSSSSLTTATNVPDSANDAIVLNLAISIAPSFGKQVSMETKAMAHSSYLSLLSDFAIPPQMQLNDLPLGAGNKPWRTTNREFIDAEERLAVGNDSLFEI